MEQTEHDNIDRRRLVIDERRLWIAVATMVLSVLFGLLGGALTIGAATERISNLERKASDHESRIISIESRTMNKLTEMTVNLKVLMRANGVEYQEGQ